MESKKEILERVLLLMKYDNRTTLSENKINILEQQIGLDSYYEKKSQSELGNTPEWKPKFKEYDGFFGKLQLPETATVKQYPEGLNLMKDGSDKKGDFVYWERLSKKNGDPIDYEFTDSSGNKIKLNAKTKFYLPTNFLNKFNNLVTRFTIPKGTIVPKFIKTDYFDAKIDKWVEEPLEEDKTFRIIVQIEQDNFYRSINPNVQNDERLGFGMSRGYFTLDKDANQYVGYNPEKYIEFRSPNYVWWTNYGFFVELIASVIITIVSEGVLGEYLVEVLTSRGLISIAQSKNVKFVLDGLLNGLLNLGIASYHFENNNNAAGTLSTICCFIPVFVKVNAKIASLFKKTSPELVIICQEIMDSIESNWSKLSADNPKVWNEWFQSLSKDAKEVIENIGKLEKSEIDDATKIVVESASEQVGKSWWESGTILASLLKKGGSVTSALSKFIGTTIVIGGEIMAVYKIIEKITGPLSEEEKVAVLVFLYEVTDMFSDDETKKMTIEQWATEYANMSQEEKDKFINFAVDSLPPDTLKAIAERMTRVSNNIEYVEDACPMDIFMDTLYYDTNNKFVGNDTILRKYPGCKQYVNK